MSLKSYLKERVGRQQGMAPQQTSEGRAPRVKKGKPETQPPFPPPELGAAFRTHPKLS